MYVILDTQAIHKDFHLANPATVRLLKGAAAHGLVVCIPEVVLQEMQSDFREQVERTLLTSETSRRDLSRLRSQEASAETAGDVDAEVTAYDVRLRAILADNNVRVLPVPQVTAATIFSRHLAHRKPFKPDGKGLNDVLIWESILELCAGSTRPIAVVTGNVKDFADPLDDLVLHLELQGDLNEIGFPQFNAELHKSIIAFVEKHIPLVGDGANQASADGGDDQAHNTESMEI